MPPQIIRVPASTGWQWFKQGWTTLWRQPLLFVLLCALQLPLQVVHLHMYWSLLALLLTPALTLAAMAVMVRSTAVQRLGAALPQPCGSTRKLLPALLVLGKIFLVVSLCLSTLHAVCATVVVADLPGAWLLAPLWHLLLALGAVLLGLVPATLLWHAPGLVHWHGLPPLPAALLSAKACLRNWRAGLLLGLAWSGLALVFLVIGVAVRFWDRSLEDRLPEAALIIPWSMLMLSNFFCFRDCFSPASAAPACTARGIA